MRVVYCGNGWAPFVDRLRARLGAEHTVDVWDRSNPLATALEGADVVLPSNAGLPADAIPATLRLVQQPAAGVDGIDLAALAAKGVPVCNAPGASARAVAEHVVMLMLMLARRYRACEGALARAAIGEPEGIELGGRRLGLVGRGRTASALAPMARGLGMRVRAIGPEDDLLELLADSDVVSVHVPLTASTRGLLGATALAAMKPGALLVNASRGPVVDRAALEGALASGRLGGVALDVFWDEPWDPADPLLVHPLVVATPHVAGSTREALDRVAEICADNVRRLAVDHPLRFRVT